MQVQKSLTNAGAKHTKDQLKDHLKILLSEVC